MAEPQHREAKQSPGWTELRMDRARDGHSQGWTEPRMDRASGQAVLAQEAEELAQDRQNPGWAGFGCSPRAML